MKSILSLLVTSLFWVAGCSAISPDSHTSLAAFDTADNTHHVDCPCEQHCQLANMADGESSKPYQLHDLQLTRRIELAATQMIEKKKTTKADELRKQLSNTTIKVDRPKAAANGTTPTTLYENHRPSVLVIAGIFKCGRCNRWHARPASGFVISEDGKAVTNHHVMASGNDETYVAMTGDGKVFAVKEVLAASEKNDLAILQLDVGDTKLKPLAISPNAPVGSNVNLISHPDKRFYTLTKGIVSRYFLIDNPKKKLKNVPMMAITADFAKGSSGAPLLNDQGHVIGIVTSTVSVYYNDKDGDPRNLQMVFKQCIPAASLLELIE